MIKVGGGGSGYHNLSSSLASSSQILDGLRFQLHKQYNAFMKHHPHFLSNGGTVSIIGHSLGSVIMYDLLLHTAECVGVNVGTGDCTSPDLSTSSMQSAMTSLRSERRPQAVRLAVGKGEENVVQFNPSVVSPEASMQLEEPMLLGEDEPGMKLNACGLREREREKNG